MVNIVQLEPDIAVAPQFVEADFADIAACGFRSVVNNRPEGETPDQLPNAQAEAAAHRHGLEFRYQPVRNINVTDDDVVETFARLMENLPGPILFYCRTGARCTILWTQAAAGRLGVDENFWLSRTMPDITWTSCAIPWRTAATYSLPHRHRHPHKSRRLSL